MSEQTARKAGYIRSYDGSTFNLEQASLRLISIVLADKELKKLYSRYDLSHMESWIEEIKEDEIISLLVQIATQYRLMEWNAKEQHKSKRFKTECVGAWSAEENAEVTELTMREACNKIIHAEEIVFDVVHMRKVRRYYFKPYIHVYGKRGKKEWSASIDLVLFVNAANQPIESFE